MRQRIEGTVAVEIDIDVFGAVTSAKVKHGIGHGCDEEGIRLVKLLKFQKKKYQGMFVLFHKTINIHFRLHDASKPVQLAYQYKEKSSGNTFTYTIKNNSQ